MSRLMLEQPTSTQAFAAELDRLLGDPHEPRRPFSYQDAVASEERDELPARAVAAADAFGLHRMLVPEPLGGDLRNLEQLFVGCRVISRRNLAIAVMYGSSLLAANPVWLWGSPDQQRRLAAELLDGGRACFAVSEADHGSDLRACDTTAAACGDGYVLSGAKWPVGNARRGRFLTTLAKTSEQRFSLMLVDKDQLNPDRWRNLPPVRTAGLRGHDLSGIVFEGCTVPADAIIGSPGVGLAQVLKALQITRTAIAALSVGAMDAVLRIALEYTQQRRLYDQAVYTLPVIREHLVRGHLDLLVSECAAIPVARALTLAPERMSLWSSVVKYLVPVVAEDVIANMSVVLGARGYLREGLADGVFQKIVRDHAVASIFEGTTHVNLLSIAGQLPFVLAQEPGADELDDSMLAALFSRTAEAPAWDLDGRRLQLVNKGRDEITHGWRTALRRVETLATGPGASPVVTDLHLVLRELDELRDACYGGIQGGVMRTGGSPRTFAAAAKHCTFHAAASCLYTWLYNREELGGAFADGEWLVLSLQRLLQRLNPDTELSPRYLPVVERQMLRSLRERNPFSLTAFATKT